MAYIESVLWYGKDQNQRVRVVLGVLLAFLVPSVLVMQIAVESRQAEVWGIYQFVLLLSMSAYSGDIALRRRTIGGNSSST